MDTTAGTTCNFKAHKLNKLPLSKQTKQRYRRYKPQQGGAELTVGRSSQVNAESLLEDPPLSQTQHIGHIVGIFDLCPCSPPCAFKSPRPLN